ncbi:MAG: hypothetical protein EZS28_055284, partial [Streblomastix strix]
MSSLEVSTFGSIIALEYEAFTVDIQHCVFFKCKTTDARYAGGALYANLRYDAKVYITDTQFIECKAPYGGALLLVPQTNHNVVLNQLKFDKCMSENGGGGLQIQINNYGTLTMTGINIFNECTAQDGS